MQIYNGGFYDHVSPPTADPPDHHQEEYTFDRYGIRVPAVLVSPWVKNDVLKDPFDHTSLLKYLTDKWQLGSLGERTAKANSFASAIQVVPRTDAPKAIPSVPKGLAQQNRPVMQPLTSLENSIVALSHALESMTEEDPMVVAARSRQILSGSQSQIDAVYDRVKSFFKRGAVEALRELE